MVQCKNCKSIKVIVRDGNFAKRKREGEPAEKYEYNKLYFTCETCEDSWESSPEGEKLYYEYLDVKSKTHIPVLDINKTGNYPPPPHVRIEDLMRKTEISKILLAEHLHDLNLSPSDWFEIKQDAEE